MIPTLANGEVGRGITPANLPFLAVQWRVGNLMTAAATASTTTTAAHGRHWGEV